MSNVSENPQEKNADNNLPHNNKSNITLTELECMDLSSQELSTISPDIFHLKFLTKLNLSKNLLGTIPEEISNLTNLLYLDVSSNQLTGLPKSLRNMIRLKYLNISNNSFYIVPEVLCIGLRSLRTIDMSDNLLMEFNTAPACIVTLLELNLRKNELVKFPAWIFSNECCLEYVDLSENPIEEATVITLANVCSKGSFETMKEIKLQNTNLNPERMDFLSFLKNLEIVHLGNIVQEKNKNFLEGFKSLVFKKSVRQLHFDCGNVAGLPSDFGVLKSVQILNLSNNSLSWLPDSFPELSSLQICDLSNNTLSFLPEKMGDLKNLKELYLSHNNLCDLPNSFVELVNLEILDLYDNQIEMLDSNFFSKLTKLKGVDLELNLMTENFFEVDHEKYGSLKDDLRKLKQQNNRLQGQKKQEDETTDVDIDSTHDSHSSSDYDEECQIEIINNEDWDEDAENEITNDFTEDDFFDPNDIPDLSHQLSYKRKKEKEIFRDNFCPADNHVQPIIPVILKNNKIINTAILFEEGQFDSD